MKSGCFQNGDLHLESTLLFLSLSFPSLDLPKLTSIRCGDHSFGGSAQLLLKRTNCRLFAFKAFQSLADFACGLRSFVHCNLQAIASEGVLIGFKMQIWQSWNRFTSAIWPFWTHLWCISPIWRDFGLYRLELVRFSMSSRCILWVETEMKCNVDLPMLDTIQFLTNSAFMVKTIIFTSLNTRKR